MISITKYQFEWSCHNFKWIFHNFFVVKVINYITILLKILQSQISIPTYYNFCFLYKFTLSCVISDDGLAYFEVKHEFTMSITTEVLNEGQWIIEKITFPFLESENDTDERCLQFFCRKLAVFFSFDGIFIFEKKKQEEIFDRFVTSLDRCNLESSKRERWRTFGLHLQYHSYDI